jgi:DNA modification methylase
MQKGNLFNMKDLINKVYLMDNLELMSKLPDQSIDLIYCDILYGTGRNFIGCDISEKAIQITNKRLNEKIKINKYLEKSEERESNKNKLF